MDVQEREAFAKEWLNGWNERDLERIISHYADDLEFQSRFAVHLFGEAFRTIKGKKDLTHCFDHVLAAVPGKMLNVRRTSGGSGHSRHPQERAVPTGHEEGTEHVD